MLGHGIVHVCVFVFLRVCEKKKITASAASQRAAVPALGGLL